MRLVLCSLVLACGVCALVPIARATSGSEKVEIIRGMPTNATMREIARVDQPKTAKPKIKGKFRELDRNRDGKISRDELEADNAKRLRNFERIDKNGDGAVNVQEWREAKGYRSRRSAKRSALQP